MEKNLPVGWKVVCSSVAIKLIGSNRSIGVSAIDQVEANVTCKGEFLSPYLVDQGRMINSGLLPPLIP